MTRIVRAAVPLVLAASLAGALRAETARYELDAEHLTIAFLVEHIGYAKLLGAFRDAEGGFVFDDATQTVSEVRVVVRTESVDTAHEARDEHLASGDFLDTAEHSEMVFTAATAERTGERTFKLEGELTLLGTTRPLELEATLNKAAPYPIGNRAQVIGASARGQLKRSEFGMTYGVADNLVGDMVEIIIELEARRVPR